MNCKIAILSLVSFTFLTCISLHAQSIWDDSDPGGDIYYNGGNVGIGTSNPSEKLDIQNGSIIGYSSVDAFLKIKRKSGKPSIKGVQDGTSGTDGHVIIDAANTAKAVYLNHYLSANVYLATGGGKVGIGTSTPYERFQIGSNWTFHDGGHKIIGYNYRYNSGDKRISQNETSNLRFTDAGDIRFLTSATGAANSSIAWTNSLIIKNSGNIGIGTLSPDSKLVVNGQAKVGASDATGLLFSKYSSALTDIPGSTSGIQITGPQHAQLVMDLQGNDPNDGFYIRVPEILQVNPTVSKTVFAVKSSGQVGIGTTDTHGYELAVAGGILAEKVYMAQQANWPDYVFSSRYNLKSLEETEAFIEVNHHLPEIPSAREVQENGYDVR